MTCRCVLSLKINYFKTTNGCFDLKFLGNTYRLCHVFTCVTLAKRRYSVRPPARNTFWVPSLCHLQLQQFSFLFIKILHNNCSHIKDVHLLFCAHEYFLILRGVEFRNFLSSKMLRGVVFVICNSKRCHSFIFKLCIMIVHTSILCTFVNILLYFWDC